MIAAKPHPQEEERLQTLHRYRILDTLEEEVFDDIAQLSAAVCDTPIALVSLVDRHRQWFKATVGLDDRETERDCSFCAHAVEEDHFLLVPDAVTDPRFVDNRLVVSGPGIRFYAGAVVRAYNGLPLGTLCVIDREPRTLRPDQRQALQTLARQVEAQLELRRMQLEKDRVSRFVVHDLKNPLTSMVLNAEVGVQRIERGSSAEEPLRQLLEASLTLRRMVSDLQDVFSRAAGALTPQVQALDLSEVIDLVRVETRSRFEAADVELSVDVEPEARDLVSDVELLRRLLGNLVHHSLDVAPRGSSISVRATKEGVQVHVRVQDEGPGVPSEDMASMFELDPGEGDSRSPRRRHAIGLAFCRVAAEALGGAVVCEPTGGEGVSFRVTLPAPGPGL